MENPNRQIVLKRSDMALDRSGFAPLRRGLPEKFLLQIARQQPFQVEPLREYLAQGNAAIVREVAQYVRKHGPLQHPRPSSGYEVAVKECTDARVAAIDLPLLLKYRMVHARTAGNVIRNGAMFKTLAKGGLAIVNGHRTCGACAAAHSLVNQEKPDINENILAILTTIPYYVRAMGDHAKRDRENAKVQAYYARRLLKFAGREDVYVYPSFYDWTSPEPLDWLRFQPAAAPANLLKRTARKMTRYAMAEGRDFSTQYAAFTMLYDTSRFGRVNDPRVGCGALLGNEMFCVSADFRSFDPASRPEPERISNTAMGSVMYAGYDPANGHFGHVAGVGGREGTHILGIMDVCAKTLHNVKRYLLENYPLIRDLTENGKRIMLMHYDRDTAKVTFLND